MAELLTSAQNPKFKRLVALREKSRLRRDEGVFVVEGRRELEHCLEAGFEVETMFVCPEIADSAAGATPPSGVRPSDSPHHPFGTVPPLPSGSPESASSLGCTRGWHVPQGEFLQQLTAMCSAHSMKKRREVGTAGRPGGCSAFYSWRWLPCSQRRRPAAPLRVPVPPPQSPPRPRRPRRGVMRLLCPDLLSRSQL